MIGIMLALCTAALWAMSPLLMASAGRRIGSYPTVLIRILLAATLMLIVLGVYWFWRGNALAMPTQSQFFWMMLSALTGMVVGDLLIYESLVTLGPRRTVQILTLHPVFSVLLGWMALDEKLGLRTLVGTLMVVGGTAHAALKGRRPDEEPSREPGRISGLGLLYALGGAICTGVGAVTGRLAYKSGPPLDPIIATAIRVVSCAMMMWILPVATGQAIQILSNISDRTARHRIILGTLAGSFGGMICYVTALKFTEAGLVSTLVATSPLFMLPVISLRYGTRIGLDLVVSVLVALAGVAVIMIRY